MAISFMQKYLHIQFHYIERVYGFSKHFYLLTTQVSLMMRFPAFHRNFTYLHVTVHYTWIKLTTGILVRNYSLLEIIYQSPIRKDILDKDCFYAGF